MRFLPALFLLFVCAFSLSALDPGALSLSLAPGGDIPFAVVINGVPGTYHTFGGGGALSLDYVFPFAPVLFGGTVLSCTLAPSNEAVTNFDMLFAFLSLSARAGFQLELIPNFTFELAGKGGWSLVVNEGAMGNGPYFGADAGFSVQFNRTFGLGLFASYGNFWSLSQQGPQYHSLSVRLGARFVLGGDPGPGLEVKDVRFLPVFPVLGAFYRENPVGEITIKNGESGVIRDVKVSFFIPQYMEAPKVCAVLREMASEEEKTVPLYALFTDKFLGITEDTKATAEVAAEYTLGDKGKTARFSGSLDIRSRNAMSWDDERKAASFVTPGDPPVLKYARGVASAVRAAGGGEINEPLRIAMGIFESLALSGLAYAKDPSTPYGELVKNKTMIDSIRFPSQTLSRKSGDCDELSILYCALLEAVDIETALVTVPGRIAMAFSTGLEPAAAKDSFSTASNLIFFEEKTWVPVDLTMIQEGFLEAWKTGAGEWRDNAQVSAAGIFPVHAAWAVYKPAGIVSADVSVVTPKNGAVTEVYSSALARFVEQEIGVESVKLIDEALRSPNDPNPVNKLGVLYARHGLYEKAAAEFEKIIAAGEFMPALVNRGNIHYLEKKWAKALAMYERAYERNKDNAAVILCIAKVKYEMDDLEAVEEYYARVYAKDRFLARKYAYLVFEGSKEEGRAEAGELASRAVWIE